MLKQNNEVKTFQAKIGKLLAIIPITPNQYTLLSIIMAILAGFMIAYYKDLGSGLVLFAIAGIFDMIDGAVARARGEVSKLGGFIDGVADRFVEGLFLFSFMFYPLPEIFIDAKVWIAGVIFLGTTMPSFIRAYADHKEVISKENALRIGGLCERSERVGIIIIALVIGMVLSMEWFVYGLILVNILSLITIFQRLIGIRNMLI